MARPGAIRYLLVRSVTLAAWREPMKTSARFFPILIAASLSPTLASAADKWQYAGESQGIAFQLQISNQCKDGSKVAIKMKTTLDHPVTVSFRLNDADWRKTFTHDLKPNGKDVTLNFSPGDSEVCHPFVDQVYVESKEPVVSQSEDTASLNP